MITNHTQTEAVHKILLSKLNEAKLKMEALRKQQNDIDLQIEDHARIILSLERSTATLGAALPEDAPTRVTEFREDLIPPLEGPNYASVTEASEAA